MFDLFGSKASLYAAVEVPASISSHINPLFSDTVPWPGA